MRTDARTLTVDEVARLVEPVMRKWLVREAWVYGSVARGTQRADSDVDITFELTEGARMGWEIWDFQQDLEEVLGTKVDLHMPPDPQRASPAFTRSYNRDKVKIYERTSG